MLEQLVIQFHGMFRNPHRFGENLEGGMGRQLIVIGGGAAGPSAAAKAKRLDRELEVHMFDEGPHVSYAACPTPYFIADRIQGTEKIIARTPEEFEKAGVHVHVNTGIVDLDMKAGTAVDSTGKKWPFDVAVYSTGASSKIPKLPGMDSERVMTLKNLQDALRIKGFIDTRKPKRAVVLGAGFIAMEMCEAFRERGLETTVLYRGKLPLKQLGEDLSAVVLEELEKNGVKFVPEVDVKGLREEKDGAVIETDQGEFPADLVLAATGVDPNVELAKKAGITLGPTGAVKTDASMRTNLHHVYAVGDCAESLHLVSKQPVFVPLGDVANKHGRIAGTNIGGEPAEFPGVVGSWCVKVFDLEVGCTGLGDAEALKAGFHPVSVMIKGNSKAEAYPGVGTVHIRLTADKVTGKLLGARVVGNEGAVSRADIVSALLHGGARVDDLAFMDLCYAPPYSPVWDVLHIAAQECLKKI